MVAPDAQVRFPDPLLLRLLILDDLASAPSPDSTGLKVTLEEGDEVAELRLLDALVDGVAGVEDDEVCEADVNCHDVLCDLQRKTELNEGSRSGRKGSYLAVVVGCCGPSVAERVQGSASDPEVELGQEKSCSRRKHQGANDNDERYQNLGRCLERQVGQVAALCLERASEAPVDEGDADPEHECEDSRQLWYQEHADQKERPKGGGGGNER